MSNAEAGQRIRSAPRDLPGSAGPSASVSSATSPDRSGVVDPVDVDDDQFLQWTARDRWFLAVLALAILVLLGIQFARLAGWGLKPLDVHRPESRKYEFQLDVNTASWVEWMQLDGIGEATARKIVADREANGPFSSVDDVARVKGIGPATLEKIRPWLIHHAPGTP